MFQSLRLGRKLRLSRLLEAFVAFVDEIERQLLAVLVDM